MTAEVQIPAKSENQSRYPQLDILRILAMCGVVIIHIFAQTSIESLSDSQALAYAIFPALMRWAVPVFIMISGALLIPRNDTFKKCFMRCRRLLYALLVFGIPMALLENLFNGKGIVQAIPSAILDIIAGRSWDVLWFLYMMIGIYLVLPVIQKAVAAMTDAQIGCTLALLFVFNCVIPFINSYFVNKVICFYLPMGSVYLMYFIAGHWAFNIIKPKMRKKLLLPSLVVLIVCSAIIVLTQIFNWSIDFSSSTGPIAAIMSLAVFLVFLNIKVKKATAATYIGKRSFGVYLIHCFVINFLYKFLHVVPTNFPLIISAPLIFVAVTLISFVSTVFLYKIPCVRKYLL